MEEEKLNELSGKVARKLRPGYLEKVYENALFHEPSKNNFHVERQVALDVYYDGIVVGHFIADIAVNNTIIIALKDFSFQPKGRRWQRIIRLLSHSKPSTRFPMPMSLRL